ncbi:hypothetical protein V8E51_003942 [Hyaloscypha variabilis]|jgi:hypothetical protein
MIFRLEAWLKMASVSFYLCLGNDEWSLQEGLTAFQRLPYFDILHLFSAVGRSRMRTSSSVKYFRVLELKLVTQLLVKFAIAFNFAVSLQSLHLPNHLRFALQLSGTSLSPPIPMTASRTEKLGHHLRVLQQQVCMITPHFNSSEHQMTHNNTRVPRFRSHLSQPLAYLRTTTLPCQEKLLSTSLPLRVSLPSRSSLKAAPADQPGFPAVGDSGAQRSSKSISHELHKVRGFPSKGEGPIPCHLCLIGINMQLSVSSRPTTSLGG